MDFIQGLPESNGCTNILVITDWTIERILQERTRRIGRGQRHEYLVKWTGYARPTWEPASALENTAALDDWELNAP